MTQRNCDDCYFSKLEGKKEPCKSCKATDDGFTNFREVPLTNADHIRAMTDEELARFFIGDSPNYCHTGLCLDGETCIGCFLKWLQQPAGEEDDHA